MKEDKKRKKTAIPFSCMERDLAADLNFDRRTDEVKTLQKTYTNSLVAY